ncbi:MAG: hypothetical protein ISR65_14790 [Bacteriovoracaceae bacterium]|nr:hypothetical protein [Bacteriovoracaceae bacterium]
MSKKDKKLKLPGRKLKDLKGFEEVFDLVDSPFDPSLGAQKIPRNDEHFDIYSFLEEELLRLRSIDDFFSNQIEILIDHPQTELLLNIQQNKLKLLKNELISRLETPYSPLNLNLEHAWNSTFSSPKPK